MWRTIVAVALAACWTNGRELATPVDHARPTRTVHASEDRDVLLGSGTVEGVVTDIWTGSPIAGITVELVGARRKHSTVTDRNGYYVFAHVEPGDYDCDLAWELTGTTMGPVGHGGQRRLGIQRRTTVKVGDGAVVRLDVTTDVQMTTNIVLPY
jgi:hypothetical protein